jgi:hypothetical protein
MIKMDGELFATLKSSIYHGLSMKKKNVVSFCFQVEKAPKSYPGLF